MEGAGREDSIGVSIRLPFEQGANPIIAGDSKYVSMKYFFTRKLMLIKESRGFVCLPGGFGTLDETFELLTLTQTGKGVPVPIVLLDTPGDPYWETVHEFVGRQLVERGLVVTGRHRAVPRHRRLSRGGATRSLGFYPTTTRCATSATCWSMRLRHEPTDEQIALLNERFGHLCKRRDHQRVAPLDPERKDDDRLDLSRIGFAFAKHGYGELRALIDTLNGFVPEEAIEPPIEAPTSPAAVPPTSPPTRPVDPTIRST